MTTPTKDEMPKVIWTRKNKSSGDIYAWDSNCEGNKETQYTRTDLLIQAAKDAAEKIRQYLFGHHHIISKGDDTAELEQIILDSIKKVSKAK